MNIIIPVLLFKEKNKNKKKKKVKKKKIFTAK